METLFERLGREKVLFRVVDEFYNIVQEDERVNGFFKHIDMVRLRQHQLSFLSGLLGGPEQYSGRSLQAAHQALRLQPLHYEAIVENLAEALKKCGVGGDDIRQVLDKVSAYRDHIVHA